MDKPQQNAVSPNKHMRSACRAGSLKILVFYSYKAYIDDIVASLKRAAQEYQSCCEITTLYIGQEGSSDTIPSVMEMCSSFDAILYDSTSGYLGISKDVIGNSLADASDAGIGLVIANFANLSSYNQCLMGRFESQLYNPLQYGTQWQSGVQLTMGKVYFADHPVLRNVDSFDGGSYSGYVVCAVEGAATPIADWSNGTPLLAEKQNPNRSGSRIVALNFGCVSEKAVGTCWKANTDVHLVMYNSLLYVASKFDKQILEMRERLHSFISEKKLADILLVTWDGQAWWIKKNCFV